MVARAGPYSGRPGRAPVRALRIEHRHAVDDDVLDAGRILVRTLVGGVVLDRGRIEHHEVGQVAIANQPAIAQAHLRGRRAGHALHRFLDATSACRRARTCRARAGTCRTIADAASPRDRIPSARSADESVPIVTSGDRNPVATSCFAHHVIQRADAAAAVDQQREVASPRIGLAFRRRSREMRLPTID